MEEEMSHLFHELSHLQEGGITHFHFTFISFSSLSAFLGGKREREKSSIKLMKTQTKFIFEMA